LYQLRPRAFFQSDRRIWVTLINDHRTLLEIGQSCVEFSWAFNMSRWRWVSYITVRMVSGNSGVNSVWFKLIEWKEDI
jgi:hypothetical protein